MFIDNGDQTWTIRFYIRGVANYVTVDQFLPIDGNGRYVYANFGSHFQNDSVALWASLAEKAYAQINERGAIEQDGTNSYLGIRYVAPRYNSKNELIAGNALCGIGSGSVAVAMHHVRGGAVAGNVSPLDAWLQGRPIVVSTRTHSFMVVGYEPQWRFGHAENCFRVYDPWGKFVNETHFGIDPMRGYRAWTDSWLSTDELHRLFGRVDVGN